MRKILLLFVCVFLATASWAQPKSNTTKAKHATAGVTKKLVVDLFDAWSTMDTAKIAPFYSAAPENIFYDITPMQYHGWAEWAKGANDFFSGFKSFKLTIVGNPDIHQSGDFAWFTELWHLDAVGKDGKAVTFDGRGTSILQQREGKWLIVHEHDSIPLPPPTAENK